MADEVPPAGVVGGTKLGEGTTRTAVVPYIPASTSLPELTVGVLVLGSILAIVLAAANAYLGMFAGMTVSASVPAAVLSMAIFKLVRRGNILQNNGVQTAAASGAGLAAGVIFTLPALVLLGTWAEFSYLETTLIAGFGGILGVLFTIPLRRALTIESPLQFPEGVATAEVLKVGAEGGGGVGVLAAAGLIGAIIKLGTTGLKLWAEVVQVGAWIGGTVTKVAGARAGADATLMSGGTPAYFGINASPALLSVGYIVGFNVAAVIFAGSVLNRWIAVPVFGMAGDPTTIITERVHGFHLAMSEAITLITQGATAVQAKIADASTHYTLAQLVAGEGGGDAINASEQIHKYVTRFLGVGGMLVGGLWSLFKLRKSLLGGITAGLSAYKARKSGANDVPRTERDMPMNIILIAIGFCVIPLFFIFFHFTGSLPVSIVMSIVVIVAGFLFSAVASYMAGLVGSSNNPVSGITISTILVSALLLLGMGMESPAGPVAAILIGGVVCCAAAIGGDNLQDLKCGQIVGSTPWKQQTMQILGVVVAAPLMAPVLNLLHAGYGIGDKLPAPQANLMGTVSFGVFEGGLPWTIVGIGAAIAVVVIIIDSILTARGSKTRVPVMAFAVGVYLPFDLNVPIFLGGIIAYFVNRHLDRTNATHERRAEVERMGLLGAAGFITGEALMGIGIAVPVAATADEHAIALFGGEYGDLRFPSLIFVGVSLALLYHLALKRSTK
jgi:uncharacterized oligopeptide transporter (OPT) family protein